MSTTWMWVVPGATESDISSGVGPRWGKSHKGIDIAVAKGTPVVASRDGKVTNVFKGCSHNYGKSDISWDTCGGGYGNYIYIDHGDGYTTRYAHLTDVFVNEGDQVSQGGKIGTVGSTGKSTGNHLHFEIRYNDEVKDPEEYLSSSGLSVVTEDYEGKSNDELPDAYYSTIEAGGTTVAQRVSGVTPQPVHAFINIWIGEKLLATTPARPNIIQSFEFSRLDGAGSTATFAVFDDNWEEIEYYLAANHDNISIEYGYYGTGMKSKLQRHKLLNYSISFNSTGTILVIETVSEGVRQNIMPMNLGLNTYNPTEAVKLICEALGYKVLPENFDESQDISADNPFNLLEDPPLTYIYNVIIPQASQENEELFYFQVDSEGYAYFKRSSYNRTRTDNLSTYIYQKGYDSNVIDFNIDVKSVFGGAGTLGVVTGYKSSVFNTKDKNATYNEIDKKSAITEATGDLSPTDSGQSHLVVDNAGYSAEQSRNILYYNMKSRQNDAYEATMTIVGDPTVNINSFVRVINVTDKGFLHHTSGVYYVLGVTDNISSGSMTTTLKLVKNATAGDITGVEIINPKLWIK